ncbi:hypothetical protein GCM10009569_31010 [Arthrobacter russicus]|uniref:Helix-turn-helix domain-containing protein n=2 Tax=Arthrobacter russicus TaxID=172040 RepID=A0ABU1JFK8_9MICC|nr:hypothetical protein [Arthrobacter russicus]
MPFSADGFEGTSEQQEARMAAPELWRSVDVASFLNISEATLSRWRKRGVGPGCIHVASVARYRPETVRAWVESMESRNGRADTGA